MTPPKTAPYGSWKSPITSDMIVAGAVKLQEIALDGKDIYWLERRPQEAGRNVIVKYTAKGDMIDVTPQPFNVRTRVHEYGGAAFLVHESQIYFSNYEDQRIYRHTPDSDPEPITSEGPFWYADAVIDVARNRLICVREDHSQSERDAINTIVGIKLDQSHAGDVLESGNDFYSNPRVSPDGSKLAWLTWNHPNMPWDGTELWVAHIQLDGSLKKPQKIAGGTDESIFQPEWSPDGILYFVSDRTGWWNLYRWDGNIQSVLEKSAEFGLPQWVFGMSTYAFASEKRLVCCYFQNGSWYLGTINPKTKEFETIDLPFTQLDDVQAAQGMAVFIAGAPIMPNSVVQFDLNTLNFEIVRQAAETALDTTYFSRPESIKFPTAEGRKAYAYFYPPQNRDYEPAEDELPPLIVKSHGGPTASASTNLDLRVQFWTSRGFAVLDVNYGGSTGYGREYRLRLEGKWGIVDVQDCVNAAKYLAKRGVVDENRVIIAGGSAGGYTTLAALTFHDFFKAGTSYYGISDLEALARDTHKFESRYLDRLIGPYPEQRELYMKRSPIHHTEKLSCPIILLQGAEDKVVPPNQSETMVEALSKKGLPVAYLLFEGEQHGFRRAENIKRAIEAELYFYSKIFGFQLADEVEAIEIDNL